MVVLSFPLSKSTYQVGHPSQSYIQANHRFETRSRQWIATEQHAFEIKGQIKRQKTGMV